jgi:hypothetical protein
VYLGVGFPSGVVHGTGAGPDQHLDLVLDGSDDDLIHDYGFVLDHHYHDRGHDDYDR